MAPSIMAHPARVRPDLLARPQDVAFPEPRPISGGVRP